MLDQDALARPALANDGRDMAVVNLQIDPIQDRPAAKTLRDILEFD